MMRRETYKGIDAENLKAMKFDDFVKVTTSRNRRTLERLGNNPRLK